MLVQCPLKLPSWTSNQALPMDIRPTKENTVHFDGGQQHIVGMGNSQYIPNPAYTFGRSLSFLSPSRQSAV